MAVLAVSAACWWRQPPLTHQNLSEERRRGHAGVRTDRTGDLLLAPNADVFFISRLGGFGGAGSVGRQREGEEPPADAVDCSGELAREGETIRANVSAHTN